MDQNPLNIWTLLLAFGAFQGYFIFISVLTKYYKLKSGRILALLILIPSFNLTNYLIFSTGWFTSFHYLAYLNYPFLFLIGPIFYFYIHSLIEPSLSLKKRHLSHLVLFVVAIFYHFPFYLLPASQKIAQIERLVQGDFLPVPWQTRLYIFVHSLQTLLYIYYAFILIEKERSEYPRLSERKKNYFTWLQKFNSIFAFYWFANFLTLTLLSFTIGLSIKADYIIMISSAFIINLLAYFALTHNKIFVDFFLSRESNKYKKSSHSDAELRKILSSITKHMEEKKPYLNPELKLSDLAEQLSVSPNIISQAINSVLKINFYEFLQEYRFKEMEKKLKDPASANLTILGVALESGFNNKNTLNRVFKKYTGKTPSQFLKDQAQKF